MIAAQVCALRALTRFEAGAVDGRRDGLSERQLAESTKGSVWTRGSEGVDGAQEACRIHERTDPAVAAATSPSVDCWSVAVRDPRRRTGTDRGAAARKSP